MASLNALGILAFTKRTHRLTTALLLCSLPRVWTLTTHVLTVSIGALGRPADSHLLSGEMDKEGIAGPARLLAVLCLVPSTIRSAANVSWGEFMEITSPLYQS